MLTPYDNPPIEDMFDPIDDEPEYKCPVCGELLYYDEKIHENEDGEIVGCACCLMVISVQLATRKEEVRNPDYKRSKNGKYPFLR